MKAIEMGVVTEMTASRLRELESQLLEFDFLIEKERQKTYASISIEDIEKYLKRDIFNNREDMRVRKMIVNTFIREIVLFEDRIVITYNFKNNTDTGRHTPETVEKMLNEVDSAYTTEIGSSISLYSEPKQKDHRLMVFLFWLPYAEALNCAERDEGAVSTLACHPDSSGVRAQPNSWRILFKFLLSPALVRTSCLLHVNPQRSYFALRNPYVV